jgi:ribosome-associated heat shock protein Hsp15
MNPGAGGARRGARRSPSTSAAACDHSPMQEACAPLRVDKWLWAARLAKTRVSATEAVKGGRVHVNGQAVKPSRDVGPGDRLEITKGQLRLTVVVTATAERRGSAADAARLYEETPESRHAREQAATQRRLMQPATSDLGARPTKRDRRRYEKTQDSRRRRG